MSFPLPEKFKPGTPLRDMVTTEIMQTVVGILNHIVIEEIEGLTQPQILKTAQPGRDTPWRIQVPSASASTPDIELSDSAPPADGGSGSPGSSPLAARGDHQHPANVDGYSPPDVSPTGGGTGSADVYARRDHTHKVICTMPGGLSQVNLFPANAAQASAYGQGFTADSFRNNNQYAVVRRVTRVVFNTAATPPTLLEFYQKEKVLPSGQIVEISAEHVRTIATTVAHA